MDIDMTIEEAWPDGGDWQTLVDRAILATGQRVHELTNPRLVVSVLLTDDAAVHALNHQWREKDKPTNVLSFPMLQRTELLALAPSGPPEMLGDVVLAYETCEREAGERHISLADHATHLVVHGLLHLGGYDHELSDADAEAMEKLEIAILAAIGLDNPYVDRS